MGVTLRDWYGPGVVIYDATILRSCDAWSPGDRFEPFNYPAGTRVQVVIDDPERPGMADVQLPNGKLVRMGINDVAIER